MANEQIKKRPVKALNLRKEFYIQTGSVVCAASSTDSITINVNELTNFRLEKLYFVTTGALDVQILDGAAAKVLSQEYVDVSLFNGVVGGSAIGDNTGYTLPQYYTFSARSQIVINVRDTSGAPNTVKAYLSGCRIFKVN